MNAKELIAAFDTIADAPDGVKRLRELVLQLAVRGKLVEQRDCEEAAIKPLHRTHKRGVATVSPPFDLPPIWLWCRLDEIGVYNGRPNASPDDIPGDAWLLDLEDIEKSTSRLLRKATAAERASRSNKSSFKAGDVLYGKLRPYLDKVLVADTDGYCTTEIVPIVPADGVEPAWLRLSLKRPDFLAHVDELSYGVKMPRLGTGDANNTLHPLPPLAEQHRIVARVDELMGLIDHLEAARTSRDDHRRAARDAALAALRDSNDGDAVEASWDRIAGKMDAIFADPEDVSPLRQAVLGCAVAGRLAKPDPMSRPCEMVQVGDVVGFLNGFAFSSEWYLPSGVRLVRNQNVGHGTIDWTDAKRVSQNHADEFDRFRLGVGDIVLSLDRPLISTGLKVAVVKETDLPCLLLQRVCCPRPRNPDLHMPYFLVWLRSPEFIDGIDPGRSNGVPHISTREIERMTLRLPSLAEQHRIVARVNALMALCDDLERGLSRSRNLHAELAAAAVHHLDV